MVVLKSQSVEIEGSKVVRDVHGVVRNQLGIRQGWVHFTRRKHRLPLYRPSIGEFHVAAIAGAVETVEVEEHKDGWKEIR